MTFLFRILLFCAVALCVSIDAYLALPKNRFLVEYTPAESERGFYSSTAGGTFDDSARLPVSRRITGRLTTSSFRELAIGALVIHVDDCLEMMLINGRPLDDLKLPYCNWARPIKASNFHRSTAPVSSWSFDATFINYGGRGHFSIEAEPASWLQTLRIVGYTSLATLLLILIQGLQSQIIALPLIVGVAVRLIYFYYSDVHTRAHDVDGHLEYIRYMLSNWSIPNPLAGWEFHQSPVFYFIVAACIALMKTISGFTISAAATGQFIALVCSILTLLFILKALAITGADCVDKSNPFIQLGSNTDRVRAIGVTAIMMIVATNPNLIFCTMRVSNDTLLFSLVSYIIYRAYLQIRTNTAAPMAVVLASSCASLLAKTNGIIGIALWLGTDLLSLPIKQTLKRFLMLSLCLIIIGGSYTAYRSHQSKSIGLFFRPSISLSHGLAVTNHPASFLSFNPIRILRDVYNDNWSESKHRSLFWEHLTKSFVFGEFDHGVEVLKIARLMLLLTLLMMGLTGIGILISAARIDRITLYALLGILCSLTIILAFRVRFPFACHQDARFIPALFSLAPILLLQSSNALISTAVRSGEVVSHSVQVLMYCFLFSLPTLQISFLISVLK